MTRELNRRKSRGITVLELMIVVVTAAVIAGIAIPSYLEQSRKGRRAAATAALFDASTRQEQFYLDNKTYTLTVTAGGLDMSAITEDGSYALTVDAPTAGCPIDRCYVVRATPQGAQAGDACGVLTIDSDRAKTPPGCW